MKRAIAIAIAFGIGIAIGCCTGCASLHKSVVVTIPNQTDALDGQVYRGLRDVQAAINVYKAQIADGKFEPGKAMALDIADLIAVYNNVYDSWVIYHNLVPSAQHNTAASLQADYEKMLSKYSAALAAGAPLPAADTIGAK